MLRLLLLGVMLAVAAGASAQLYRWVDKDGKVRYTDTPPPAGVKARTLRAPASAGSSAEPEEAAAKGAPKGPLTPAQQEQEFRKRQLEGQKGREKEDQAKREAETKQANCASARQALATLESGQRITRTDAQGERAFLEDDARAQETERARQSVREWCG
jgi:hypothetical protein